MNIKRISSWSFSSKWYQKLYVKQHFINSEVQVKHTWPICFIKSTMMGRVPMPVDQTAIPYGKTEICPFFISLVLISFSDTFTTIDPVFTSIPSRPNLSSAKVVILLSNLQKYEKFQVKEELTLLADLAYHPNFRKWNSNQW